MEIVNNIPAKVDNEKILQFVITPMKRIIQVEIFSSITGNRMVSVDVTEELNNSTAAQKTVLRGFFKKVASMALGCQTTEITGDFDI